jgi:hypothetical protein
MEVLRDIFSAVASEFAWGVLEESDSSASMMSWTYLETDVTETIENVKEWYGTEEQLNLKKELYQEQKEAFIKFFLNWALISTARYGHLAAVEYLISLGADAYEDALARAAAAGQVNVVKYLEPKVSLKGKLDALNDALWATNVEAVKYLVDANRDQTGFLKQALKKVEEEMWFKQGRENEEDKSAYEKYKKLHEYIKSLSK